MTTMNEQLRQRFSETFTSQITTYIETLKTRQASDKNDKINAETAVKTSMKDINEAASRIRAMLEVESSSETLGKEFDNMMSMPQVKGIKLDTDAKALLVYLEVHSRKNNDERRWKLTIFLNGPVKFTSLSYRNTGYVDNEICLGNITGETKKLILTSQFDALVALLIEFLEDNF